MSLTEWLLALVPSYGPPLLGGVIFLSCFALPLPASMMLMAAGGFSAVGDLSLPLVLAAAVLGLIAGDQCVYFAGRYGGARLMQHLARRAAPIRRARDMLVERGGIFLFLSRWLFSPIGPYVNFAAGASGLSWPRFVLWGTPGELVWVSIYLGLGYGFAGQLEQASDAALSAVLALGAGALALWLGRVLIRAHRRRREAGSDALQQAAPPR
ncbi:DedA family protein [Pseudooceanicola sp. CBS1P-1]|uniref:DedA family protein n=1 Tax=Pseudooceanicola albus TaxID=2692189 RepID=A0A6L7G1V2_9RHOB|nr:MULTISPECIES: DedA family protein [Pseudooceanicola]MBT9385015.1 DedA family protein [Pseudooceanicola endophyticus]MXN17991.1 DedA family protein [Pseudooceanicola albus]